jgi:hypothetical protein
MRIQFPEIARRGQLEVLRAIGRMDGAEVLSFGGGTALALVYLGHRISVDLDFFAPDRDAFEDGKHIVVNALRSLNYKFDPEYGATQATFMIDLGDEKLKVDVLLEPDLSARQPPSTQLEGTGVWVLALSTLASLKVKAAISRGELDRLKDIVDLLAIEELRGVSVSAACPRDPRVAGELLEALEELEDLIRDLPTLRLRGGFAQNPSMLLRRKDAVASSLLRLLWPE